ncbi:MAG: hypothetical protein NT031_10960, partial [Planctomycetota bacterium]|nr:hypothetical protein [Planctomycetota bacterium]
GMDDVFVHDRLTGQNVRASVSSAGVEGNGMNTGAAISADGRFVSFTSPATNLVPGDNNAKDDVFVRDLPAGTTERVSVSSAGTEGNNPSVVNAISGDGRYVVFQSTASNLVAGDTNGAGDIFVRDRRAGTTVRVSVSAAGAQGNDVSYSPVISANGRYVAFESLSTNLVLGDTNATRDIFVRDLQTGAMQRASVSTAGTQGDGPSSLPSLSPDGRYVTFASSATNLVVGDANAAADMFVRDTLAGSTRLFSASVAGVEGNADSGPRLCMALTGEYVVFKSSASNLVPGDANGRWPQGPPTKTRPCGSPPTFSWPTIPTPTEIS